MKNIDFVIFLLVYVVWVIAGARLLRFRAHLFTFFRHIMRCFYWILFDFMYKTCVKKYKK